MSKTLTWSSKIPTIYTRDWGSGVTPTLFLVGEYEVIYPAKEAVERLGSVAPKICTRIIPDAGHDITIVQAELLSTIVLDFLGTKTPMTVGSP
ncbi:MAG: alpha/beta hydrolase [Pseudomonadota bacterium]